MSERINDGGSAFPRALPKVEVRPDEALQIIRAHSGMSLRDYFAAKAMQALIASRHTDYEGGQYHETQVAESAYAQADAMLAARDAQ